MILEFIEAEGVGPFSGKVRVGPFSMGINVLSAPNESGKSTLIKAAARALFDRYNCKDEQIKALQPAGTSLSPRVSVVFETGKRKFKVEKTFLNAQGVNLWEWKAEKWMPIAESDQADLRLNELLRSKHPARGASNAVHWGLFGYLWARQGDPVTWPDWKDEAQAGQLIQSRLARVQLDPLIEKLCRNIWAEYLQIFTATGLPKANGELKRAESELLKLDQELNVVCERMKQIDDLQSRYVALCAEIDLLQSETITKAEEAKQIREAAQQAELISAELRGLEGEYQTFGSRLNQIHQDFQKLNELKVSVVEFQKCVKERQQRMVVEIQKEAEFKKQIRNHELMLSQEQTAFENSQKELDKIRLLLKWRDQQDKITELEGLLHKAKLLQDEISAIKLKRDQMPEISSKQLKTMDELVRTTRERSLQLEALGLSIQIIPKNPSTAKVLQDGTESMLEIPAEGLNLRARQSVELDLDGWGIIQMRSGAREVAALQEQMKKAEDDLQKLLETIGVRSSDEARREFEKRTELEQQLKMNEATLQQLLEKWESVEKLNSEVNQRKLQQEILNSRIQGAPSTLSLAELEASEQKLEILVQSRHAAVKELTDQLAAQRRNAEIFSETLRNLEREILDAQAALQRCEVQIQEISSRYQAGMEAARNEAQAAFVQAEARFQEKRKKLPPEHDKLPERNRRITKAAEELAATLEQKRRDMNKLEGQLAALGSEGLYSRETELVEKRQEAEQAVEAAQSRGWALRIVHDLFLYRKHAATRSVLGPLESRLSTAFAEISGDHHRKVFLDDQLQIAGIGSGSGDLVDFQCLSQGAKEQLVLALRLAVACELSTDEPQVLVLDDVLVNTDSMRQQRVLDVLQNAGNQLQVIILTCHGDRYRGVGKMIKIADQ